MKLLISEKVELKRRVCICIGMILGKKPKIYCAWGEGIGNDRICQMGTAFTSSVRSGSEAFLQSTRIDLDKAWETARKKMVSGSGGAASLLIGRKGNYLGSNVARLRQR